MLLIDMWEKAWFFNDIKIGDAFITRDGAKVIFRGLKNGLYYFKGRRHRYFAVRQNGYYNNFAMDNNDVLGKY